MPNATLPATRRAGKNPSSRANALRGQIYHGPDPVPEFAVRALMRVAAAVTRAKKRGALRADDLVAVVRTAPSLKSRVIAGPSTWAIAILSNRAWWWRVTRVHQPARVAAFVREIDALQPTTRGRA